MTIQETIAAVATPPGKGGVGIIRISGAKALGIASTITQKTLKPRYATYADFNNQQGDVIDSGVAIYFKGPNSFTGEDVVELQGHGGPVILDQLLAEVIMQGARMARPGEFSERAFINNKIDLAQAEAIADAINAGTKEAAKSAIRSLQGEFSKTIEGLRVRLVGLRMLLETAIDFSDEDIDFVAENKIIESLSSLLIQIKKVRDAAKQGVLLQAGLQVVIAGAPNAGKSTLLNRLSQRESAIVTDIAGTTRDVLRESISIDGLPLHIIDTAGIRETDNVVEKVGIDRAKTEMKKADLIIWIEDALNPIDITDEFPADVPMIRVKNKIDLVEAPKFDGIAISAKNNMHMDKLKDAIKIFAGFQTTELQVGTARRRHLEAMDLASKLIEKGVTEYQNHQAIELLAEDLRQAGDALGKITGVFTSDDLLGKIFSEFCIGK